MAAEVGCSFLWTTLYVIYYRVLHAIRSQLQHKNHVLLKETELWDRCLVADIQNMPHTRYPCCHYICWISSLGITQSTRWYHLRFCPVLLLLKSLCNYIKWHDSYIKPSMTDLFPINFVSFLTIIYNMVDLSVLSCPLLPYCL